MGLYINLEKALKLCDNMIKDEDDNDDITNFLIYLANTCGEYIESGNEVMLAPQILPESCDPKGSTRYHCHIINEKFKIDNGEYRVEFPDTPKEDCTFRVCEYSTEFDTPISVAEGDGVVLKENNNNYSWWFNL